MPAFYEDDVIRHTIAVISVVPTFMGVLWNTMGIQVVFIRFSDCFTQHPCREPWCLPAPSVLLPKWSSGQCGFLYLLSPGLGSSRELRTYSEEVTGCRHTVPLAVFLTACW